MKETSQEYIETLQAYYSLSEPFSHEDIEAYWNNYQSYCD